MYTHERWCISSICDEEHIRDADRTGSEKWRLYICILSKPRHSPYRHLNRSQTCWLDPSCIVQPKSAGDVSAALRVAGFFRAPFAVRSGGHSPNPGWSSASAPVLLIDLAGLDFVSLSADRQTASVGPGNRWIDVIGALDPHGVSVISGRIPGVGVGGLLLGGMYLPTFYPVCSRLGDVDVDEGIIPTYTHKPRRL